MSADDFQRYLRAKRTVDDRSLDRRLLDTLTDGLGECAAGQDRPLRVLEVGAGVGTMIERLLEWDLLPAGQVEYTAVDVDADSTAVLPDRLADWATEQGRSATLGADGVTVERPDGQVSVTVHTADAVEFARSADRSWDLLVGMAFLDIVETAALSDLLSAVAPGGFWYFPVTFDGGTRFGPDHPADEAVERQYHRHMDTKPGGDSRAGQHTLDQLRGLDQVQVTDVAGSDWVVYPRDGEYPGDEAYFLRYVLGTVESALGELDHEDTLSATQLDDWLGTRRRQVDEAELLYLTHQLDLLGRVNE